MADRALRVMVAAGPLAALSPWAAATALARGFADRTQVAVAGLAAGGAALGRALSEPDGEFEPVAGGWLCRCAELTGCGVVPMPGTDAAPVERVDPLAADSGRLGRLGGYALQAGVPGRLVIDLTGVEAHDAGAGLLAGLGAEADVSLVEGPEPLGRASRVELAGVRDRLAGCDLIGVIGPGQADDKLLGLRGITSRLGRRIGTPVQRMLAIDAALERFATLAAADVARSDGAGAAGGLGFAILALGGRLVEGAALSADLVALDRGLRMADLVVTACDSFDIGSRGGGVVAELARRCEAFEVPLLVVAPVIEMSVREMRTLGVESAHPLEPAADPAAALTATGRRLATGWTARW